MGTFTDRYSKPLPGWVSDIKEGVKHKVISSIASQACREGNIPALRQLLIVFWPFVDEFPKIIRRGCVKFIKHELITDPGNADDLLSLLVLADKTLTLIERDEADHRELWIKAAEAVGLTYRISSNPRSLLWRSLSLKWKRGLILPPCFCGLRPSRLWLRWQAGISCNLHSFGKRWGQKGQSGF